MDSYEYTFVLILICIFLIQLILFIRLICLHCESVGDRGWQVLFVAAALPQQKYSRAQLPATREIFRIYL